MCLELMCGLVLVLSHVQLEPQKHLFGLTYRPHLACLAYYIRPRYYEQRLGLIHGLALALSRAHPERRNIG